MAILADGRAGFARQERQTVHAGVVRFGLILMTTGAGARQVQFEHRRMRVPGRHHVVLAVAIGAGGRCGGAHGAAHAVDARGIDIRLLLVADRAVHRLRRDVVVGMIPGEIAVATGAQVGLVDGSREFRRIDKQRNDLADRIGLVQVFISMAFQAVAVGDDFRPDCREGDTRNQQVTERHFPEAIHTLCTQWPCGAVPTTHILANALLP